jgi:NitT/TauT family transport system permease protein
MRRSAPSSSAIQRAAPVILTPAAFLAVVVIGWEVLVRVLHVPAYLVPRPSQLLSSVPADIGTHIRVTAEEVTLGFVVANVLAFVSAIAFAQSRTLERGLYPIAIALKTTPLVAIAPLLVLWFGTGLASKVVAAALISFFPMLVNTIKGVRSIGADENELFLALRASRRDRLLRLQLPKALPFIFAALKISSSLAVVGAIVGEFVGAKAGLGFLILQSSYHLDSAALFVTIILAALLGFALFGAVCVVERLVCTWEHLEA